jgi:hypothetical protein
MIEQGLGGVLGRVGSSFANDIDRGLVVCYIPELVEYQVYMCGGG